MYHDENAGSLAQIRTSNQEKKHLTSQLTFGLLLWAEVAVLLFSFSLLQYISFYRTE